MNKREFATLMKLFDAETTEILGDAKFAVEIYWSIITWNVFGGPPREH